MWRHGSAATLGSNGYSLPLMHLLERVDMLGRIIVGMGSLGDQNQARLKSLWRIVTAQESADYSSLEP
jgi:hypothetical protein